MVDESLTGGDQLNEEEAKTVSTLDGFYDEIDKIQDEI